MILIHYALPNLSRAKKSGSLFKAHCRVCGVDFSNFRRRKRGNFKLNFSRKKFKIARIRRCARRAIAFAFSFAVCCVSKCAEGCLQMIFCICGVDFSNFRRRKRCNFSRRIRRARAFGVAHSKKSHLETARVFILSCAVSKLQKYAFGTRFFGLLASIWVPKRPPK